jgi:hypothetical protein
MLRLTESLRAWNTDNFEATLKNEIEAIDYRELPLQESLTQSSYASPEGFNAVILKISEEQDKLRIKAGIFYRGVIAGCNCADDPSPVESIQEYCTIDLSIDKVSAETSVRISQAETHN